MRLQYDMGLAISLCLCAEFTAAAVPAVATPDPQADYAVAYQITTTHSGTLSEPGGLKPPLKKLWSQTLTGWVSYPVIAENIVVVTATNAKGPGTEVVAFDYLTGAQLWQHPIQSHWKVSAPAYDRGKFFVLNYDGGLSAFVPATGAQIWSIQLPNQNAFASPPTARDGVVYVGGAGFGGTLYAVAEETGKLLWSQTVIGDSGSSPAVDSEGIYVSYPCQVYRFSPSGRQVWNRNSGCDGGGGRTMAIYNGYLFDRQIFQASLILRETDGSIVFGLPAQLPQAYWGNSMFFLANRSIQSMSLTTGNGSWSFLGDGHLASTPIVVNGVVYIGSGEGRLYGLDAETGALVWEESVNAPFEAPAEFGVIPITGLGAGQGILVAPAGYELFAFTSK